MSKPHSETERLETLWAGTFGDEYIERNATADAYRGDFWRQRLTTLSVGTALEVGCNVGGNLRWLAELIGPENLTGVDVNEKALEILRARLPGVTAVHSTARRLPFDDGSFDLAFTVGVLIHQPPESLRDVMSEIVRCSRRYVLCGEYAADDDVEVEVEYRGHHGALFKRDFGRLYLDWFPVLHQIDQGFLARETSGFDDVTYWVFEKR